jgi:molecular chaperone DnaK (HSP70)
MAESSGDFTPKVVVAIDFGTHGTGFAWATVSSLQDRPENRRIVYEDHAVGQARSYPKDLTAVLVNDRLEPLEFGVKARKRWLREQRRQNPDGLGYASRFKMAMKPGAPGANVAEFAGILEGADREVVRGLVTATLRRVRERALKSVAGTAFNSKLGFTEDDIRWCVTVPAIWDQADQRLMRTAAYEAGFPNSAERLLLVQEPEAAAVECVVSAGTLLDDERSKGRLNVEEAGGRFMVVDCGGGTVDITGYQIRPPGVGENRLKEIGIVDGGRLGSAYVNQAFVDRVLERRFGAAQLKALSGRLSGAMAELLDAWEAAKVSLDSETEADGTPVIQPIEIGIPGALWDELSADTRAELERLASEKYVILVTSEEAAEVFDSVVEPILEKIESQRKEMRSGAPVSEPDQILVVGGFGRSTYLRDRIAHRFGDEVRVLMPEDPAVAVLNGAIHFAYDPGVIWARRSKYTYGYACSYPWRPGVDPAEYHFVDGYGEERCTKRFAIILRRGGTVLADEVFPDRMVISSPHDREFDIGLYVTHKQDPVYVTETGCAKLGVVKADVSGSVGLPKNERILHISFAFGRTEVEVRTRDPLTGVTHKATIEFEELYGRRDASAPARNLGRGRR